MLVGKSRVQRCIRRKRHLSRGTRIVRTRTTSSKGEIFQMVSVVEALVMIKWAGFLELLQDTLMYSRCVPNTLRSDFFGD